MIDSHVSRDARALRTVEPSYRYSRDAKQGMLEVELPGVSTADTTIEVEGDVLRVTAKRYRFDDAAGAAEEEPANGNDDDNANGTADDKADGNGMQEDAPTDKQRKASVTYKLALRVGRNVDREAVRAEQRDGVLQVVLPVKAKETPKTLRIAVN